MGRFYNRVIDLPELEGWWTVPQVAERLDVTRQHANQWVVEGRFPNAHRISEIILIPEDDLDAFEELRKGTNRRTTAPRSGDISYM